MAFGVDGSNIVTDNGQKLLFPRDGNTCPAAVAAGYDATGVAHILETSTLGRLVIDTTLGSGKAPVTQEVTVNGTEYTILGVVIHTSSTGSAVVPVTLTGKVVAVGFIAPSAAATFTVEVLDSDGFTVHSSRFL